MSTTRFQFFRIRSSHLYQDLQGHNLPAALLFLALGIAYYSLPQIILGLAFSAAWLVGIHTPDTSRWRFHLATALAVLLTPLLLTAA